MKIKLIISLLFVSIISFGQRKLSIPSVPGSGAADLFIPRVEANSSFYPKTLNPAGYLTTATIGDGTYVPTTVTEYKNYYHNEMWWNHGLDTSTGAITSNINNDITDYLHVPGNESITLRSTSGDPIILWGWTYDSSFTAISKIKTYAGSSLRTFTFTTPSNARYLILVTKALGYTNGGDSNHVKLEVKSTNTITYQVPIIPDNFTGSTSTIKIQKALDFAQYTSSPVVLRGYYKFDSAAIMNSGNTVVLQGATLTANVNMVDNFFRNEAVAHPKYHLFNRGNRNIKIIGFGTIQGHIYEVADTSEWYKYHILHFCNVENFEVSGLTIKETREWALLFEQSRIGIVSNITFEDGGEHLNQDGVDLNRGCHGVAIENIRGCTEDDMVALNNVKVSDQELILDDYIAEPYRVDQDIYDISIRNIFRNGRLFFQGDQKYGGSIRILTGDALKVHDVTINGVYGMPEILMGGFYYITTAPTVNDCYNINISDAYCRIQINQPIKYCYFNNVVKFNAAVDHYYLVKPPNGSYGIYRRYLNYYPEYIDSVGINNGTEYLHNL